MESHAPEVVRLSQHGEQLKDEYFSEMLKYVELAESDKDNKTKFLGLMELQRKAMRYFNHFENFISNSDLLGAHSNERWAMDLAKNCAILFPIIIKHHEMYKKWCGDLGEKYSPPAEGCYSYMQEMVAGYLPDRIEEFQKKFSDANLPCSGFGHPRRSPSSQTAVQDQASGSVVVGLSGSAEADILNKAMARGVERRESIQQTGILGSLFTRKTEKVTREGQYDDINKKHISGRLTFGAVVVIAVVAVGLVWYVFGQHGDTQAQTRPITATK